MTLLPDIWTLLGGFCKEYSILVFKSEVSLREHLVRMLGLGGTVPNLHLLVSQGLLALLLLVLRYINKTSSPNYDWNRGQLDKIHAWNFEISL